MNTKFSAGVTLKKIIVACLTGMKKLGKTLFITVQQIVLILITEWGSVEMGTNATMMASVGR